MDENVQVTKLQLQTLAQYRFSLIQTNPIRKWQVGDVSYEFKRGKNQSKGIYMSSLGSLVRHIFYDKKTHIAYSLEGNLSRRYAIIEDPLFLNILDFEWKNNIFYAPYIPYSLEYTAQIYKYLIQNVIDPLIEVDFLKNLIKDFIEHTFNKISVVEDEEKIISSPNMEYLIETRKDEFMKFRENLLNFVEEFKNYKSPKCFIIEDFSDYSLEEEYANSHKRMEQIKKILNIQ